MNTEKFYRTIEMQRLTKMLSLAADLGDQEDFAEVLEEINLLHEVMQKDIRASVPRETVLSSTHDSENTTRKTQTGSLSTGT